VFGFSQDLQLQIVGTQFHAFVFYNLLRNVGGNIYNMKNVVEGLKKHPIKKSLKIKLIGFLYLKVLIDCW